MSDAPVKTRIEIFRGTLAVHCGDVDNWEGWTASLGTWTRAGDFAALFIDSGENLADAEKAVSLNTTISPYCIVRVTYLDGTFWRIFIKRADTHVWVQAGEYNSTGIKRINLTSAYSGLIEAIQLEVSGSQYQQCEWDYLIVSDKSDVEITDTSLELEDCTIHLGQTDEVDDFELLLDNLDHKFTVTTPISEGDHIKIYGCREGQTGPYYPLKLFCGRIETDKLSIKPAVSNKVTLSGRSYGEELFRDDITALYGRANYEGCDDAEDHHQEGTYQLVGTIVFDPAATERVHVQMCTNKVYLSTGSVYGLLKFTYLREGEGETTIATDLKFSDTSYCAKQVGCDVLGEVGKDVTIYCYTKCETGGVYDCYSKENRATADFLVEASVIVKDIIDNYTTLKHAAGETELVESTDTYLTAEYEDTKVFDALQKLAQASDKSGAVGYVFRVRHDGLFQWFPKNSKTNPISLTDLMEELTFTKSIARIRNAFTVFGNPSCSIPQGQDWCENLTNWSASIGSISLVTTGTAKSGVAFIEGESTDTTPMRLEFKKTFPRLRNMPASLRFWASALAPACVATKHVRLLAPDTDNYFYATIATAAYEWILNNLPFGHATEYQSLNNPNGTWFKHGCPRWTNICGIQFFLEFTGSEQHYHWGIDALHFADARFYAETEDTPSQGTHGLRRLSPETDDELYSYTECNLRVAALKAYYKDAQKSATVHSKLIEQTFTDRLLAADKIRVQVTDDNIDEWLTIGSIEYALNQDQEFETVLTLGIDPPRFADFVYALQRSRTTYARTKGTGGGGVG